MDQYNIEKDLRTVRAQFKACRQALFVMGDPVRQDILILLSEKLDGGMNVTEITAKLSLSRPAVSHHLKVLKDGGFLKAEKTGTQIFYSIEMDEPFSRIQKLVENLGKIAKEIKTRRSGSGKKASG
ncbi:MAG: winged helix-turn-helix transcriptional regulator [Spirochaetes bacterium]|uniref:Winged helix-turn-helix transcriptional regulator n=1 Tax=Candidatus Avitreponema avistercoris TaxID=2840705 RepID=A0A9D9HGE2_9SPIR|nr:winged helix-turn-helix transcriptional regulator [Candidatus Avitreponema avistercoris]